MTLNLSVIAGPPLAVLLFFGIGIQWGLLLNALSFGVSWLTILCIQAPARARREGGGGAGGGGSVWQEFGEGVRFLLGQRMLRMLLVTVSALQAAGGVLMALNVFFVGANLRLDLRYYGWAGMVEGLGLLAGATLMGWRGKKARVSTVYWSSALLIGVTQIAYSRQTLLPPALALLFLQGLGNGTLNAALGPLVLRSAPQEVLGRVWALLMPAMSLSLLLAAFAAGTLASELHFRIGVVGGVVFGPYDTVILGGGCLAVAAGVYGRAVAKLK